MPTTEMKQIIKATVHETMNELFVTMGIDISNADGIIAFQQDMHYLRANRLQSEANKNKAFQLSLGVLISGIGAAIVMGLVHFFNISR